MSDKAPRGRISEEKLLFGEHILCPRCKGKGGWKSGPCMHCQGRGYVRLPPKEGNSETTR